MPTRLGREYNSAIIVRDKFIAATGIPASTIQRFQTGEYVPREKSIKKLAAFYNHYMYYTFRGHGANKEDSRYYCKLEPDKAPKYLADYTKWARRIRANHISRGRDVPLAAIVWSMAHSQHPRNDWEQLSQLSGLQKYRRRRPKKPKREARYEH